MGNLISLLSPVLELGEALEKMATGKILGGIKQAAAVGAELCIKKSVQEVADKGEIPNLSKYGLDFVDRVAFNAATAKEVLRDVWQRLLTKAIDPSASPIEIRHSDIENIQKLNPSDCVLILGAGVFDPGSIGHWAESKECKAICATDRRFTATESIYKVVPTHVPLKLIKSLASLKISAPVSLADEDLIFAIQHQHDLFTGASVMRSVYAMAKERMEKSQREHNGDSSTVLRQLRELNIPPLVHFELGGTAQRMASVLGVSKQPDSLS